MGTLEALQLLKKLIGIEDKNTKSWKQIDFNRHNFFFVEYNIQTLALQLRSAYTHTEPGIVNLEPPKNVHVEMMSDFVAEEKVRGGRE